MWLKLFGQSLVLGATFECRKPCVFPVLQAVSRSGSVATWFAEPLFRTGFQLSFAGFGVCEVLFVQSHQQKSWLDPGGSGRSRSWLRHVGV